MEPFMANLKNELFKLRKRKKYVVFLILGALLCVVGVVGMLAAPWLYRRLVEKRKQQIAPEILRLTEELSRK